MRHSPFAAAFTPGVRFAREQGGPVVMSTRVIGVLRVPSGRVGVGDPGTTGFGGPVPALARAVPIGVYPVEVALAEYEGPDVRVACARVRFAAGPAVRWEPALFEGQEARADGDPAYGVDTGTGCFFDAAAGGAVDEATQAAWGEASERNYVDTWTWLVAEAGDANVVMFSSGWGDGLYTSYWGFDEHGGLVELVTDFDLLCEPVRESLELALPLPSGVLEHPWLAARGIEVRRPWLAATAALIRAPSGISVELSEPEALRQTWTDGACRYEWKRNTPGLRLVISVFVDMRPLAPVDHCGGA